MFAAISICGVSAANVQLAASETTCQRTVDSMLKVIKTSKSESLLQSCMLPSIVLTAVARCGKLNTHKDLQQETASVLLRNARNMESSRDSPVPDRQTSERIERIRFRTRTVVCVRRGGEVYRRFDLCAISWSKNLGSRFELPWFVFEWILVSLDCFFSIQFAR